MHNPIRSIILRPDGTPDVTVMAVMDALAYHPEVRRAHNSYSMKVARPIMEGLRQAGWSDRKYEIKLEPVEGDGVLTCWLAFDKRGEPTGWASGLTDREALDRISLCMENLAEQYVARQIYLVPHNG